MRSLLRLRNAACAVLFVSATWSHAGNAQALQFYNLTTCRAVDTRYGYGGIVIATGVERAFQMKGVCGVPTDAKTVTLNMTAVGPTGGGFFVLYPAGTTRPPVSNINFLAGEVAIGNGAVVPIAVSNPDLALLYQAVNGYTVHVVLDVTGYFK